MLPVSGDVTYYCNHLGKKLLLRQDAFTFNLWVHILDKWHYNQIFTPNF